MMSSNFDFERQSPVLFKPTSRIFQFETPNGEKISLEHLHDRLMQHLKKGALFRRDELRTFLIQAERMNPESQKNKWLLMKIKGLMKFILKKKCDLQNDLYENSSFEEMQLSLLTNDNFESIKAEDVQSPMSVDNLDALRDYAKENYEILKSLTGDQSCFVNSDGGSLLEGVYEIHDLVEKDCDSLMQISSSSHSQAQKEETKKLGVETNCNIFDDLDISNDEFKEEFDREFKKTEEWMDDIITSLIQIEVDETMNSFDVSPLNESMTTTIKLTPKYDEENTKIIQEVCSAFRTELQKNMEKDKDLEVLRELINL